MPAEGGPARRLTYAGVECLVAGWTPDGRVVYFSPASQPFRGLGRLIAVDVDGGLPAELPFGPANFISFEERQRTDAGGGGRVISRPSVEAAHWKRYRGGTAGDLWVDPAGDGTWRRLIRLEGNPSRPNWVGDRIYFISDHEGVGNLYSCTPAGADVRRHTDHEDFYARNAAGDGRRIVYHAGADLFVFDPATAMAARPARSRSNTTARARSGTASSSTPRGTSNRTRRTPRATCSASPPAASSPRWGTGTGRSRQHGEPCAGRYRLGTWLHDGSRIVAVSDDEGRETLTIHDADGDRSAAAAGRDRRVARRRPAGVARGGSGRAVERAERAGAGRSGDRAPRGCSTAASTGSISGFDFSPDGKWVAYPWTPTLHTSVIRLCRLADGADVPGHPAGAAGHRPGVRPGGEVPLLPVAPRNSIRSTTTCTSTSASPRGCGRTSSRCGRTCRRRSRSCRSRRRRRRRTGRTPRRSGRAAAAPLVIDVDGIEDRVEAFPVPEGIYQQVDGIKGKALFTSVPLEGEREEDLGSRRRRRRPGRRSRRTTSRPARPRRSSTDITDFARLRATARRSSTAPATGCA